MSDLIDQLAEATATTEDGDHLVQKDYSKIIHSDEHEGSAQQASAYLHLGEWGPVSSTCTQAGCCLPDHLTIQDKEAEDLALVASHTITLADLYRKARSRGLVTARTEYGG